jgi:hypothetical protein
MSVAHGCFFVGDRIGFHIRLRSFHDFGRRATAREPPRSSWLKGQNDEAGGSIKPFGKSARRAKVHPTDSANSASFLTQL